MRGKQIKRRLMGVLLCLMLVLAVFPVPVHADTGPKPSVQVTFENMGDGVCYGTLLSKTQSTGPASVWDGDEEHISNIGLDREIWQAFVDYEDADGFYFLQWAWRCDETKELRWTYYPPQTFKILLYYPETGEFLVSGICERYAFDSYFTIDVSKAQLSAEPVIPAKRSYDYTREVAGLMARLILTMLIELGVAWLFGFRRKEWLLLIVATNMVTQVVLNVILNAIYNIRGPWAFFFYMAVLELAVFVIEAVVYYLLFNRLGGGEIKRGKIFLYALAANLCSFVGGLLLAKVIPFVF